MNPKTTLIMGVMFLGVFVILATLKLVHAPTDIEKIKWQDKVIPQLQDVDVETLTQASLARDKEQLEFNYVESGDRWQMVKPLDVLAQTSAVRDLFFDLKNLSRRDSGAKKDDKAGVFVPKGPSDLVEYGLDSPSSSITVTYKPKGSDKATKTVTLQVGAATADKDGLYVKLANEKYVFVVNKSNLRGLEKKTADFRQQKLVTVSRFDSDMLRLEWPDRVIEAEKKDAKWHLVEPIADRGDTTKLEELIGKLGDLKADGDADYIDNEAKDLAQYGLDVPQLVAEIRKSGSKPKAADKKEKAKEKEKPTIVEKVLIGKPVEGREDKVYAKLADQKYVIAVAATILNDLAKQPNDLRSHDLVEMTQGDVDYVRIERPGGQIALAKKEFEGWEIVQPKTTKAEQSAVTELVRKIDELDVKEFIDQANPSEFGLDQPVLSVAIWQKGLKADDKNAKEKAKKGEKKEEEKKQEQPDASTEPKGDPIRVSFGKPDDEKKVVYVRRGDEPTIFAVSSEGLMDVVDRDYLAYRTKLVLSFVQSDVAKLTVRRDGKTFSAEHKKQKEDDLQESWRMLEPVDAPADSNTVDRILRSFARLNAKKFFIEGDTDLKNYGLDEPRIRATATLKAHGDQEPEHVLLVGNEAEDGGFYAKLGKENLIFSVERTVIDDLNSELHDHSLLKFDSSKVDGLTLTWADGMKFELVNKKPEGQATKTWSVPGDETFKLDTKKVTDLVGQLALLNTDRFVQYNGDFTEAQGLMPPALLIEVNVEGESSAKTLRIGASAEGEKRYAATGDKSGPVALVPEVRFKDLLAGPTVFAQPEEKKPDADKPDPAKSDDSKKEDPKPDTNGEKKSDEKKSDDAKKSETDKKSESNNPPEPVNN